jgi:hypothetical protein
MLGGTLRIGVCQRHGTRSSLLEGQPDQRGLRSLSGQQGLHDHAAGDTPTGGRVGFVVVHAGMDHDRCSVGAENRMGLAPLQRDRRIQHLDHKLAALWNVKIRHIAGVGALRRHEAMLLATWVEVSAGGIERRVTFSDRVHMKGMFACRQPLHRYLEQKCRQESASTRLFRRPCRQYS